MKSNLIPIWKIAATAGGAALTGAAVWLNAEHVAASEGWASPLVLAGVIVTVCAAMSPPFAERALKSGQWGKGAALWLFFLLAVAFSLTASITRSSGHRDGQVAGGELINVKAALAREAYDSALKARNDECKTGRGPKCRTAEAALDKARNDLAAAPAAKSADPGAQRMAAVLGVSEASVSLYSPLALPLGLELGGFIFLATGLAPRRREKAKKVEKTEQPTPARSKPVAKQAAAKAKVVRKKPLELSKPMPLLPAGSFAFDQRAALRPEI
jgi:hypothetical protein